MGKTSMNMRMNCKLDQSKTPLFDAYHAYAFSDVLALHVPGHKMGHGADNSLLKTFGLKTFMFDNTSLPQTDCLQHPSGPVKLAQELAADLYGAQATFFSVNGTSGAVMAMVLSVVGKGDKIIIPRNVHKSVLAGIVLAGAIPVYIQPVIDNSLGIAHSIMPGSVAEALRLNPDAKAVLVSSPTYYGVTSDIRKISGIAHACNIPLLVDEAHGAHLRFCPPDLPEDAIAQGADIVSQSSHKTIGSLTQSSMLHVNTHFVSVEKVAAALSLIHTTSPSFLLLGSLDCARRNMALHGEALWRSAVERYRHAREKINRIEGFHAFDEKDLNGLGERCFDPTKLTVCCRDLELTGRELESMLFENYNIQVEFSDYCNILIVGSYADSTQGIDRLVDALQDIAAGRTVRQKELTCMRIPEIPQSAMSPREAFFGETRKISFMESRGAISAEFIVTYPPGIPVLCPGEVITQPIIDYACAMRDADMMITGMESKSLETIQVKEDR